MVWISENKPRSSDRDGAFLLTSLFIQLIEPSAQAEGARGRSRRSLYRAKVMGRGGEDVTFLATLDDVLNRVRQQHLALK